MRNLAGTGGVRTGNSSTMTADPTELPDADLVARARAGDDAAFGALVGRHQAAVLRLAAAISGSIDDAPDIAQEALVKAHRSLAKLTDPSLLRPWMMRIVANEAKNHLRSRDRRRKREEQFGSWVIAASPDPEASCRAGHPCRRRGPRRWPRGPPG